MNTIDFVCGLFGGIALVGLFVGICLAEKDSKEKRKAEMKNVAYDVLREAKDNKSIGHWNIFGFDERVNELIKEYMDKHAEVKEVASDD